MSEPIRGVGINDRLRLRLQYAGETRIDERWAYARLRAPYWRFYVNRDAGAEVIPVGGPALALPAGHLVLVPAWLQWRSRCRGQVRHGVMHVDLVGVPRALQQRCFTGPVDLGARAGGALLALFDRLRRDGPGAALDLRFQALAADGLAGCIETLDPGLRRHLDALLDDGPMNAFLATAESQLHRRLRIDGLAAACGMSVPTLNRLFRRHFATSPAVWLRERRLAQAAERLACCDDSIEMIAEAAGFADRHGFSKAFARLIGCPPARYRQQHAMADGLAS